MLPATRVGLPLSLPKLLGVKYPDGGVGDPIAPIPAAVPSKLSEPDEVWVILAVVELNEVPTVPELPENAAEDGVVSAPVESRSARKANEMKIIFLLVEENPERFTGVRHFFLKYKFMYIFY